MQSFTLGGLSFSSEWGGGHENDGGHRIFSFVIGGHKKNQKIFEWLQVLMTILFNEIARKKHIFCATCTGGYMFLQHCSSGGRGVIKYLIIK